MLHYEPIKVTIDAPRLAKVILDMVVWHYDLSNSIVLDKGSLFISKFWSLLYYFLGIKRRFLTVFHPQIDGQTKRQNSTMKAYLQALINFKQNNWIRLLQMAKFTYNNTKNASTSYILFKLNCSYYLRISYEEEVSSCSKFKSIDKLSAKLRELMIIYWENLHHTQKF